VQGSRNDVFLHLTAVFVNMSFIVKTIFLFKKNCLLKRYHCL